MAFWAPNRDGYTRDAGKAGLYRADIAAQIVESARGEEIAFVGDLDKPFKVPRKEPGPDVIAYDAECTMHLLSTGGK